MVQLLQKYTSTPRKSSVTFEEFSSEAEPCSVIKKETAPSHWIGESREKIIWKKKMPHEIVIKNVWNCDEKVVKATLKH